MLEREREAPREREDNAQCAQIGARLCQSIGELVLDKSLERMRQCANADGRSGGRKRNEGEHSERAVPTSTGLGNT